MRKEYRGRRKLGDLTEVAVMPAAEKHGFAMFKILSNWPHIVGEFLAQHCTPKGLQFPSNQTVKGVLLIEVENPGFSLELQASERIIVQKIATFFGYQAIDKIRVEISRTRKKTVKLEPDDIVLKQTVSFEQEEDILSNLGNIEDDLLRDMLASIAQNSFTSDE